MKTVSVITPTHSREEDLLRCVRSVAGQDYPGKIEHLIVNDRSRFVTGHAEEIRGLNPAVRILTHEESDLPGEVIPVYIPSRLSWLRNFAVESAVGEYVCYLDDDNYIASNHISSLVSLIGSEPGIDIAYGWRFLVREDGSPFLEPEYPWTPEARLATGRQELSRYIYERLVECGIREEGSNLVRDTVLTEAGEPVFTVDQGEFLLPRELQLRIPFTVDFPWRKMVGDYSEDHDFIERAYQSGCRFACTREATLFYTVGGVSQSESGCGEGEERTGAS